MVVVICAENRRQLIVKKPTDLKDPFRFVLFLKRTYNLSLFFTEMNIVCQITPSSSLSIECFFNNAIPRKYARQLQMCEGPMKPVSKIIIATVFFIP